MLFSCVIVSWLLFHGWILLFCVGVCSLVVDFVGWLVLVGLGWFAGVLRLWFALFTCCGGLVLGFLCVGYWFLGRCMFVGLVCVFVLVAIVFGFFVCCLWLPDFTWVGGGLVSFVQVCDSWLCGVGFWCFGVSILVCRSVFGFGCI